MITINDIAAERHFLLCYARHLGASRADAEDVAQNALINAFLNIDNYTGAADGPRAWLSTILRNSYFDFCRRNQSQRRRAELAGPSCSTVACAGEDACQLQELERGLLAMSPRKSETFCLQALGLEYQEIADRTGYAIGTVKSRISRAREALLA